ncbi:MAG: protein kinase, partial [Gemmatimonadaceae bacterium]
MIGTTIGNYRIVERLGDGGMGAVYRAVDEMLDRDVAIKVLRPELARQATLIERFRQEAIALARLNHPRIATLLGFERSGENFLMIMEYVRGDTLEAVVQRSGRLRWTRAAELTAAVLDALDHAHDRGVVHRDIKPANVMLAHNGAVKVMDFGIARMLGKSRQTQFGHAVGTPTYMSPEQLRGEEVDGRTDLYAVGAVLFELLTGHMAFEADSDYALMMKQLNEPPPAASSLVPEIPGVIDEIIQRAMSKKREDRFPHANAFREALERAVAAHGAGARRVVTPPTRLLEDPPLESMHMPGATAEHGVTPVPAVAETRLASSTPPPEPRAGQGGVAETRLVSDPGVAETRLAGEAATPATRLVGSAVPVHAEPRLTSNGVPLSKDWRTYVAAAAVLLTVGTAVRVLGTRPAEPVRADTTQVAPGPTNPQPLAPDEKQETMAPLSAPPGEVAIAQPGPGSIIPRPAPPVATTPPLSESGRRKGGSPPSTSSEPRPVPKPDSAPPPPEKAATPATPTQRPAAEESPAEGVREALQSFAGAVREKRTELVGSVL